MKDYDTTPIPVDTIIKNTCLWTFTTTVGDLVVKRIILPQGDPKGKWTPTYEGPFVIKTVFFGRAMILGTMDGEDFPHPVSADIVKKYYA